LLDHLIIIAFAVIYPIVGFVGYRRWLRKIEAGMPVNRKLLYLSTITWHWTLCVLAMLVWALSERDWGMLGFGYDLNLRFWAACGLTIAAIALLVLQMRQLATDSQEDVTRLKSELGQLILMMPHNGSELLRFNMLSITAGIVEETLWRGFLIWYLAQFMPLWAAAVISAVGFGIAHGYQGLANVPRVMLVGAIFSGLYILSGSLWLPMILHSAVDLLQGRLAYDVLRRNDSTTSS
jgi:membrane protease YdiL (CAAX protease family)